MSAEQNIQALEVEALRLDQLRNDPKAEASLAETKALETQRAGLMENMREAAHSIYEEYVSEKANPRLKIDESVVKRLIFKIRTESPDADWFNEAQNAVYEKLQSDERFLESFRRSVGYVKLLAELELLKDVSKPDDDDTRSLVR